MSQSSSDTTQTAVAPRRQLPSRVAHIIGYTLWLSAAFIGAQFLVVLFARILISLGVPVTSVSDAALQTILAALSYIVALIVTILVPRYLFKLHTTKKELGLTRLLSFGDIGMALAGAVPYLVLTFVFVSMAQIFIPGFNSSQTQDVGFQNLNGQSEYVLAFIALVVLAPIAEETMFRGYLYSKLRRSSNLIAATIVTSMCFAVLHMQLNVGIDVFALSLVLCALREITGSIWSGILLHMLKNGLAFYFLFVAPMLVH